MAKSQIRQYVFNPTGTLGGTIAVPGKIDLQQLLIITNTTTNTILYNFADVTYAGTTVSFTRNIDTNFVTALDYQDGITLITIPNTVSTAGMTGTNTLQIFFEQTFQYVRSPEIGTDAFERQRVAAPQSLLDADFEYGMQPTKWLTISQLRGYPSIYEIPGTDQNVTAATTDASVSSGGALGLVTAESVITITTASAHGFTVGTPFTIKGFNSAITGFDRAEGSFIVFTVPTATSFTFIAKGKVGYTNGDSIYTAFVQLRQGGYYTGSNINSIINATATQTNSSTGYVTFNITTNFTAGAAITLSTVLTNITGCDSSNNRLTLGTTIGLAVGMPITLTGNNFGGLVAGRTYYVVSIIDNRNITVSISNLLTPVFVPTITSTSGNMNVTGGAAFGGLTNGTQYYVGSVINSTQATLSNNIIYNTTITQTIVTSNWVRFATTTNMTVGEQVIVAGTTIGNLSAGTYYVIQIVDSVNAILSTSLGGSSVVQSSATGSMTAQVGVPITLTGGTVSGYMWATVVAPPIINYSTPTTVVAFTGTMASNVLTATGVTGTFAAGQSISGTGVPSNCVIIAQLTPTGATAITSTTLVSGGLIGAFSFIVNSPTGILAGQILTGTGIPVSTFVTAVDTQTNTVTVSNAFTGNNGTGTYYFYNPYGVGTYSISGASTTIASGTSMTAVNSSPTITVNTVSPHGFIPGQTINMYISSENGTNNHTLATGPFFVETVTTNLVNGISVTNQFTYTARGVGTMSGTVSGTFYARPDSFYTHRPLDGGVQLGTSLPSHGAQAIRMSKKYIRYQSGKSINFNTGLLMAPNYDIRSATATNASYVSGINISAVTATNGFVTINSGTYVAGQAIIVSGSITSSTGLAAQTYYVMTGGTGVTSIQLSTTLANQQAGIPVTFLATGSVSGASVIAAPVIVITTDDVDHGCQLGATVNISGIVTQGYSGTYTVVGIIDERSLQVVANGPLGTTNGQLTVTINNSSALSLVNWYGASVRSGTYDEQNGVFWQFDGQTISAVKRSSTFQLAGTISVVVGSGQVIGLNTKFTTQLQVGDRFVIRGMSHMVTQVVSDTLMYVNPQYRGASNVSGIKAAKTVDYAIPQSKWNMDRCDGTNGPFNPSGYLINQIKMQMVAVQWTWYGAGFIDWMLRGPEGKYITVHRLRNNNLNNEAWMRTGNLPVRYEVVNEGPSTRIVGTVNYGISDLVMTVNDTSLFPTPATGSAITLYVDNEFIQYTSKISTVATATTGGGQVTVASTANMAVGQPIVFMHPTSLSIGGIVSGQTYYIASIGAGYITLATNIGLTLFPTLTAYTYNPYGANSTNYYMTINAFVSASTSNRGQTIQPWATGGYRTFQAQSAAAHTPTTGVLLVNGSCSPIVSHWGAAFIEDGGFDSDRSYIFNYSQPNVNISTKKTTAFAVRLAPSVSNALTGDLGGRELINRASFLLQSLESCAGTSANANTAIIIEGIINPSNMPAITNIQFASLASAVNPTGQPSFSQVAPGTSMVFTNAVTNTTTISNSPAIGGTIISVASTAGIQVGDDVFFPASTGAVFGLTKVSAINSLNITINQGLVVAQTASAVVQFSRSTYALPGETVFSYVNSPANKDALDLTTFKELTNTPIGGRGCYPNGCDILFINAYITQGAPLNQNLILRWGEAQA